MIDRMMKDISYALRTFLTFGFSILSLVYLTSSANIALLLFVAWCNAKTIIMKSINRREKFQSISI